jgi:hypothetical protein
MDDNSQAINQPNPVAAPLVPETWPGAWGVYKNSKRAVLTNTGMFVVLFIISALTQASREVNAGISIVIWLISMYFMAVATIGYLTAVRGQKPSFGQAFRGVNLLTYIKLVVNYILLFIIALGSFLLLIVPFVLIFPRIIFAPYLVVDKHLGPIEAFSKSWELTKGHNGKVWGLVGVYIAFCLLLITIIGIPFAIYFLFIYSAAIYVLYEFLMKQSGGASATPVIDSAPQAPTASPEPIHTEAPGVTPPTDPAT